MKKFTREDYELCDKITTRAMEMDLYPSDHRITAMMDIQNAAKYFNMRLDGCLMQRRKKNYELHCKFEYLWQH